MYSISIEKLEFNTIIGILDFERVTPQNISINFSCDYVIIDDFISYVELRDIIKNMMMKNQYYLIENALNDILDFISSKYPQISNLYLKISKPNILDDCIVSVSKKVK